MFSGVGKSVEETSNVYSLQFIGLITDIAVPYQANPGETINVTVKTEAVIEQQPLYVKNINLPLYGLTNVTTVTVLAEIIHLKNSSLIYHEVKYNITLPEKISLGLTYGEISCDGEFMGAPQKIPNFGFVLIYIEDLAFEELQSDYESLNTTYHSTLEDYNQLESKFKGEADSSRV